MEKLLLETLKDLHKQVGMSYFTISYSKRVNKWKVSIGGKILCHEEIVDVLAMAINYIHLNKKELPIEKYTLLKNHTSFRK